MSHFVRIPFDFRERGSYTYVLSKDDDPINAVGIVEELFEDLEELSDGEFNAAKAVIEAYNAALPEPEEEFDPDPSGLLLAVFGALGKPIARAIAKDYLDFTLALQASPPNYTVARAAVEDAHDDEALTQEQYDLIQTLFDMYHIPEA